MRHLSGENGGVIIDRAVNAIFLNEEIPVVFARRLLRLWRLTGFKS